ncbi:MAG: right-handed parallel beta-helix repeat-containing protein, partial [Bacteroidales bacterium]|nr:right-handed parallel beta-helix repeat-containing protein [Bacteroidales bacterium]
MKKLSSLQFFLVAVFTFINFSSYADINVSGHVTSNATWSGNVYITDVTWVDPGVTITILPGTNITIYPYKEFYVQGYFHAVGTASDKILFHPFYGSSWRGIEFQNISGETDSTLLVYCVFSDVGSSANGAIHLNQRYKFRLENCEIKNCDAWHAGGIYLEAAGMIIKNSSIHDNTGDAGGGIRI